MKKEEQKKFEIDSKILTDYVDTINSIAIPVKELQQQLNQINESTIETDKQLKNIKNMINEVEKLTTKYPNELAKIYTDIILQILDVNKGILLAKMVQVLDISREYVSVLAKNNIIERISRGIYISSSSFEDSYFSFQQKYKKIIFSHMTALYFYDMTEEFPYNYTVTVPKSYHVDAVSEKCNVFYVSDEIYEMGIVEVETPNGNKVRAYDKERCICDIINSKRRMDSEQVKKAIREYNKRKDKNLAKLSEYSKKLGINEKVMEMVGESYYE